MAVNDDGSTRPPRRARRRRSAASLEAPPRLDVENLLGSDDVEVEVREDGKRTELVLRWTHDSEDTSVGEAFEAEARRLLDGDLPPADVARRAARIATAEEAWTRRLGTLFDATDVVGTLNVSKQRVSTLTKEQRLIALPVNGRMRYPAWQFVDLSTALRAALAAAHRELVQIGGVDPWSAADWATHPHPDLDGIDPVGWLRADGAVDVLLQTAQRDARRAAQ